MTKEIEKTPPTIAPELTVGQHSIGRWQSRDGPDRMDRTAARRSPGSDRFSVRHVGIELVQEEAGAERIGNIHRERRVRGFDYRRHGRDRRHTGRRELPLWSATASLR